MAVVLRSWNVVVVGNGFEVTWTYETDDPPGVKTVSRTVITASPAKTALENQATRFVNVSENIEAQAL